MPDGRSCSFGKVIFLDESIGTAEADIITLMHESGHYAGQYKELGFFKYLLGVGIPSMSNGTFNPYYDQAWEVKAEVAGEVKRGVTYGPNSAIIGEIYFEYLKSINSFGDWVEFLSALPYIKDHEIFYTKN